MLPAGMDHVVPATIHGSVNLIDPPEPGGQATVRWMVGDLDSGEEAMLDISGRTAANTRGIAQTAKASIFALETIGGSEVQELDPRQSNNMDQASVTPMEERNVAPTFAYKLSVAEHATSGTEVGNMICVREPNANDTLTFSLSGDGADDFEVEAVDACAQIVVAATVDINYQKRQAYDLILRVSDGRDRHGNASDSVDDRAALWIDVVNDPSDDPTPTVGLTANATQQQVNSNVLLTWTLASMPAGATNVSWNLLSTNPDAQPREVTEEELSEHLSAKTVTWGEVESRAYEVVLSYHLNDQDHVVKSNVVTIEWTN